MDEFQNAKLVLVVLVHPHANNEEQRSILESGDKPFEQWRRTHRKLAQRQGVPEIIYDTRSKWVLAPPYQVPVKLRFSGSLTAEIKYVHFPLDCPLLCAISRGVQGNLVRGKQETTHPDKSPMLWEWEPRANEHSLNKADQIPKRNDV